MTKYIVAVCVALALVAYSAPATALAGPGGGGGQRPLKVQGVVTAVNAATGQVAITTIAGQSVVLVAVPTTKIERNGVRVALAAFKIGDRGQALFAPNKAVSKIEAVGM